MFEDRTEAGRQLAARLSAYSRPHPLVLALPRGGVPVAVEVATELNADLDVLVVRKLGAPDEPELALGAIGEDDVMVVDHSVRRALHVTDEQVADIATRERHEIERRVQAYRGGNRRLGIACRNVIIVDDGLATGSTATAAVRVARHMGASHITVAAPVGSAPACHALAEMADDFMCLSTPEPFVAVGQHYRDFTQVADDEVVAILQAHPRTDNGGRPPTGRVDRESTIPITVPGGTAALTGRLVAPPDATGLVVFAHGSGSSHLSPRNVAVATQLQAAGLGTLLFDLLTPQEADVRATVFDIELLAERLVTTIGWLRTQPDVGDLPVGLFGASTGAAAALVAAAQCPDDVRAVVSRGGRPDLAGGWLQKVQAPTLLIVGALDYAVLDLNREAQRHLHCPSLLEVVGGARHLFEEPGTLSQAARLARGWFLQHLPAVDVAA